MDAAACPICLRPGGRPADVVAELRATWVTAPIDAPLPGYACVVSKHHVVEPYELTETQGVAFWEDCMEAAQALNALFHPAKMNYEIHGNTIAHLHMHIYPRYPGDPHEGRPIDHQSAFRRTLSELDQMRQALEPLER